MAKKKSKISLLDRENRVTTDLFLGMLPRRSFPYLTLQKGYSFKDIFDEEVGKGILKSSRDSLVDILGLLNDKNEIEIHKDSFVQWIGELPTVFTAIEDLEIEKSVYEELNFYINIGNLFKRIRFEVTITKEEDGVEYGYRPTLVERVNCVSGSNELALLLNTYKDSDNTRDFEIDHDTLFSTFIDKWNTHTGVTMLMVYPDTDYGKEMHIDSLADFVNYVSKEQEIEYFLLSEAVAYAKQWGFNEIFESFISQIGANEIIAQVSELSEERGKILHSMLEEVRLKVNDITYQSSDVKIQLGSGEKLVLPYGVTVVAGKSGSGKSYITRQIYNAKSVSGDQKPFVSLSSVFLKYGEPDAGSFVNSNILKGILGALSRHDVVIVDSLSSEMIARGREPAGPSGISYTFGSILSFISSLATALDKVIIIVLNIGAMTRNGEDIQESLMFDWLQGKVAGLIMNCRDTNNVKDVIETFVTLRNTPDRSVKHYILHDFGDEVISNDGGEDSDATEKVIPISKVDQAIQEAITQVKLGDPQEVFFNSDNLI